MKKFILLSILFTQFICFSQISVPTNIYFTVDEIKGNADPNTIIKIDRNLNGINGTPIITVLVNINGYFAYSFDTPLPLTGGAQPSIDIWAEDNTGAQSAINTYQASTPAIILQGIINNSFTGYT